MVGVSKDLCIYSASDGLGGCGQPAEGCVQHAGALPLHRAPPTPQNPHQCRPEYHTDRRLRARALRQL